jgi:outer membrane protein
VKRTWAVMVLVSTGALASGVKDFIDAAEQQNLDRKISIEQRNRAAAEYRQAWTGLLPSLTASGGWTHNQYPAEASFPTATGVTKLTIVPADQFDGVLRFDLPLIDIQRWFRVSVASAAEESAAYRELVTRDLIRRQVVASYFNYAAALALRDSAQKSAVVAEAQLKLVEIRSSAGAGTELDTLRSKAEVARTKQTVADTVSLVAVSRRTLRSLTGLEPPEVVPQPVDDVRPESTVEELETRIEELPGVKAADKDREAAARITTGGRLAFVPTVSAQFTQRFTNATGFQGQVATYNGGINFSWRLDAPTFMALQAQQAAENIAGLGGDKARLQAKDQINSDWQRLAAATIKIEAAKAQVEAAQRAAQVARDRFAVGASTQVDVIQAERDMFSAEVSQIQARTELATARVSLHISAGQPLE